MQQVCSSAPGRQRKQHLIPHDAAVEAPWIERRRVERDDLEIAASAQGRDQSGEILADPGRASARQLRIDRDPHRLKSLLDLGGETANRRRRGVHLLRLREICVRWSEAAPPIGGVTETSDRVDTGRIDVARAFEIPLRAIEAAEIELLISGSDEIPLRERRERG